MEFFAGIYLDKYMPAKWNFVPCFIFLVPLKSNCSKVKNKTQNTLILNEILKRIGLSKKNCDFRTKCSLNIEILK